MTKRFTALAFVVAAIATPVAAETSPQRSFTRDGETYVYTATQKADRVLLRGRRLPSGSAFELTVRGNKITGYSGGVPVAFTVPNAQAKVSTVAVLASR